jgi:hypothetical protein
MTDSALSRPVTPMAVPTVADGRARDEERAGLLEGRAAAALVAVIALAIALIAVPNWPVGVFQDDGIYVMLGKALASGDGYRYLNLPGSPYATHYPPGYPLFLAALWKLSPEFPQNVAVFTFANAGFLALAAFGTFLFARGRLGLSALGAAVVAIAGTVSMPAIIFGVFVLSEPMFMACLLAVLIYAERQADEGGWREALFVGLAAGALGMIRTNGMFVAAAFALVLMLRRRYVPAVLALAGAAVFVVPWSLWVAAHGADVPAILLGKYGPYNTWLTNAIREHGPAFVWDVIVRNTRAVYGMLWVMFAGGPGVPNVVRLPVALAAASVVGVGVWRLSRRAPVTAWFLAAYMALVMIWPFEPTRFVWALLPILAAIVAMAIEFVIAQTATSPAARIARWSALTACACLVLGFGAYNVNGVRQEWRDSVPRVTAARATPVVEWIRAHTKPTDVIAMEDDPLIYLYTGRHSIPVGTFTPEEYLAEQTYSFGEVQLGAIVARYKPAYVIGTTTHGVMAARGLSTRTPPTLRVHTLLPTAAIFAPVVP